MKKNILKTIILISLFASNSVFAYTNTNEVKSFVYKWFSQFDKNDKTENFTKHLSPKFLIKFPDTEIKTKDQFKAWYSNILKTFKTAKHDIEYINVTLKEKSIVVDLIVNWEAKEFTGKIVKLRIHQNWVITKDDNNDFLINNYIADVIN